MRAGQKLTAEWCRDRARLCEIHEPRLCAALRIAANVLERHAVGKARDIFEAHYDADPCPRGKVTGMEAVFASLKETTP